jgi:uncharacterized membrane protein YfcA
MNKKASVAAGLVTGFFSGLLGMGGSFVSIPAEAFLKRDF